MTDIKGRNVFISGPMTGCFAYNVAEFMDANKRLNELGPEHVFNPAYEWCTELSLGRKEKPHEFYMRRCIAELVSGNGHDEPFYDLLVSLPGWQDSEGATLERSVAMACGIKEETVRYYASPAYRRRVEAAKAPWLVVRVENE